MGWLHANGKPVMDSKLKIFFLYIPESGEDGGHAIVQLIEDCPQQVAATI
jgi:hypothetical protein